MERGDSAIRDAFVKIKEDMDAHSKKISKLFSKSKKIDGFMLDIKKDLLGLKQGLENLEKKSNKMKKAKPVQKIPEFDKIKKDIKLLTNSYELYQELKKDVELLKKEIKIKPHRREIKKMVKDVVEEARKPTLKTKVIQRFDRNKKRIIIKKILDLIAERQLTLSELKTLVVDELRYCSKASFYRYFKELKRRKLIDFIEFDGTKVLVLVKQKPKLR